MQHILVAVDGSPCAARAAAFAAELARLTRAKVTLVHVASAVSAAGARFLESTSAPTGDSEAREAQASFEAARAAMGACDASAHLVEMGQPAEALVDAAKRIGADHIVMGSRGLSPLKELVLGSVSEGVLRAAPCPVTIVR